MKQFYTSATPENQLPARPRSFSYNSLHRCASKARLELRTTKQSALTYLPGEEAWGQGRLSVPGMLRRFLPLGAEMQLVQPRTCPGRNTKGTCKLLCIYQGFSAPCKQSAFPALGSTRRRDCCPQKPLESVRRGNGNPVGSTWAGVSEDHRAYNPFSWCPH